MVGFRVLDVGALIVFLVWFFHQRFDSDDPPDDDGPGGGPDRGPRDDPGGGGLERPLGRARPGRRRLRTHRGKRPSVRRRGGESMPMPHPARVRRPHSPLPAHRR